MAQDYFFRRTLTMSEVSKLLGLDKHPAELATINNTLRSAGAAVGLPSSLIGLPDATTTNPTGTSSTLGTGATTPSSVLHEIETAGFSVGVPVLKSVIATLAVKIPNITTQEQADLTAFLDKLVDNAMASVTAKL
jgi:hypothetical protein